MRRYRTIFIAVIGILCFLLTSCSFFSKEETNLEPEDQIPTTQMEDVETDLRKTVLYYQDNEGYLVPVMRQIPWEEGIGKAALSRLISTTENMKDAQTYGLNTLIPEGTEIDLNIKDGLATVDLSREALNCDDAVQEANMVAGIVNTLIEFPAVEKVQILLEGKADKKLSFGTDISKAFEKMDLNPEVAEKDVDVANASKVVVYYEDEAGAYLVPVTRFTKAKASLEIALEELLNGPNEDSSLTSSIPKGCKINSVDVSEGIATIDFSEEFQELAESMDKERLVLKSVMLTCQQFPEIEEVKITVDGNDYIPGDIENYAAPTFVNEYE